MIGTLIAAIIIGIIAGYLGRALLPGDDSMGFVATVVVGIVGALVGWALFTYVLGIGDKDKFDLGGIIGAIIGTMLVLLVLRAVRARRDAGKRHRAPSARERATARAASSQAAGASRAGTERPPESHSRTSASTSAAGRVDVLAVAVQHQVVRRAGDEEADRAVHLDLRHPRALVEQLLD